jgi:hypothetical protein
MPGLRHPRPRLLLANAELAAAATSSTMMMAARMADGLGTCPSKL